MNASIREPRWRTGFVAFLGLLQLGLPVDSRADYPVWKFHDDWVPSARAGHDAIYDPVRHQMLISGGATEDWWSMALGSHQQWRLAPGVYFVRIAGRNGVANSRICLVR